MQKIEISNTGLNICKRRDLIFISLLYDPCIFRFFQWRIQNDRRFKSPSTTNEFVLMNSQTAPNKASRSWKCLVNHSLASFQIHCSSNVNNHGVLHYTRYPAVKGRHVGLQHHQVPFCSKEKKLRLLNPPSAFQKNFVLKHSTGLTFAAVRPLLSTFFFSVVGKSVFSVHTVMC